KRKNEVLRHWRIYEYEEMTKLYALFLLTVYFEHDYQMAYQQWVVNKVNESVVSDVIKKIKSDKQTKWKEKEKYVAHKVYKVTRKEDYSENIFVNILILIEIKQKNGIKNYSDTV